MLNASSQETTGVERVVRAHTGLFRIAARQPRRASQGFTETKPVCARASKHVHGYRQ